ncbi:TetR/AcrR family transcriptional regulator [Aurantibacillus circumpalustris]|uniref:TetR/AcrR family transcriptional regulator n=1 Tax=Aurantibacillus circumpalustris TaxID=3036359 RepID=UPI00295A5E29|nr:TetR/AcrR family transcriptional regulator [Aurantibacillus circumpalustris]
MSKAEKTREFIIEKAAPIFNKKGYAGTSLNDLIHATGLTKGSIYGNFENKDEVATAVFEYNIKGVHKRISEYVVTQKTAPGKLIGITDYYRCNWKQVFEKGGCPLQNASVEADDNLKFLKGKVQHSVKRWAENITGIIETGKQNGEIKKNIVSSDYAYMFITLLEGGIMLGKIMNNPKHLIMALDRIKLIVESEMKK